MLPVSLSNPSSSSGPKGGEGAGEEVPRGLLPPGEDMTVEARPLRTSPESDDEEA